jgi:hypothetical protein
MLSRNFWTPERIALLGTDSDGAIAKRLGIPLAAVWRQRTTLGILPHRTCKWGETELALLRSYTDEEIAEMTGRALQEIAAKRNSLKQSNRFPEPKSLRHMAPRELRIICLKQFPVHVVICSLRSSAIAQH